MSDIRFNRWLHQSGTGGVSQDSSGSIGIGTTVPTMALDVRGNANVSDTFNATTGAFSGNISAVDGTFSGNVTIGGTLTYEDVANIDAVGIVTAQSDVIVGGGLTVTGISTFNNDIEVSGTIYSEGLVTGDSESILLGNSNDLAILHDGSNNYIDGQGDGSIFIRGNPTVTISRFWGPTFDEMGVFNGGGSVDLYYNGAKKFETADTGAVVTGILTATSSITGSNYEIAGISSSISDTAVDVFVYDTRKDSDGGAWRKRTQHTSWYNETLNTSIRGSRREFPAVAVLVLEGGKLTIYDGDDPDLPMWMVFNTNATEYYLIAGTNDHDLRSVAALNGIIVTGNASGYNHGGAIQVNFVKDDGFVTSHTTNRRWTGGILNRNSNDYWVTLGDGNYIVSNSVNDVAMTVLPNAPIDNATGLPVPTIAVATDGGVSVIRDDGTVFDTVATTSGYINSRKVEFEGEYLHIIQDPSLIYTYKISAFNQDRSGGTLTGYTGLSFYSGWVSGSGPASATKLSVKDDSTINIGHSNTGLSRLYPDYTYSSNSLDTASGRMVSIATTSYNTGWMHGDIKGAFLSDTDATNVTGSELVTNGDFSSNSDWTYQNNGSGWTISGGTLDYDGTGTLYYKAYQNITGLVVGETYVLSIDVISLSSSNISFAFATSNVGSTLSSKVVTATGTHSITWVADRSNISVYVQTNLATQTYSVDNFSLRIADPDRSVNNNGLQVFGTVNKSAVATGAELVAYGPFSNSNYLYQPYNSDLDLGTGDFSVIFWIKSTDDGYVFWRNDTTGSPLWDVYLENTGSIRIRLDGMQEYITDGVDTTNWTFVCFTRTGGTVGLYVNAKLGYTEYNTSTITNPDAPIYIGRRVGTGAELDAGYVSLMRISGSAPSAEQVKKMYEDEKVLFQENAACTLYGSSDAVTALAYDDSTDLLYAGTSSGRSDFQGLRRINNTTTAVTTAMSASNGLVAEQ